MLEVNINTLIDKYNYLNEKIPDNIIIVGKIDRLNIEYKYNELDLSKLECNIIRYINQEGESIENHKLPNSLKVLLCYDNQLTLLPTLPNSLQELDCSFNQLTSFNNVQLPNSLKYLDCYNNKLISLCDLPNSLKELNCSNNQLISLPDLPNSLEGLYCDHNQLLSLPDFTHINHKIKLSFTQELPISYIPCNKNIKLYSEKDNKIIIEGYPHNPITNQEDFNKYMKFIKNYKINRIKSARK
tara:strand:+ start:113 stop:838 length:726 start_codon:yes stop_codon:yes gene_type:complete